MGDPRLEYGRGRYWTLANFELKNFTGDHQRMSDFFFLFVVFGRNAELQCEVVFPQQIFDRCCQVPSSVLGDGDLGKEKTQVSLCCGE